MTVIFKNLDIETLSKKLTKKLTNNRFAARAFKFINSNRILIKFTTFCLVGLLAIMISIISVGITVGFNVNYSGKVIATVSDASVFDNAKNIAIKNVGGNGADKAITNPEFVLTLTVSDNLCNPKMLADAIIENTNGIVAGFALVVNGETIVCTESDSLSDLLEARRTAFYVEGAENSASFADKVEIRDGYYLKEDIKELSEAEKVINKLDVKTVSTVVSENTIPYTTKKIKTSSYKVGYSKVYTKGENGLTRTTVIKETLNGSQNGEDQISSVVITEPVEQIELIGTAYNQISAAERAKASSNGFICPLNPGTYKITSYYGDGRSHKGIDLAADKGVAIFSVADGVVTYAGYDSDFGYNVIVDHGNGIKTRYAHASALCVSKGAKVSQGDMIATVGNTGYSTGNHLHFEVIVNGSRVNPAPYIGL